MKEAVKKRTKKITGTPVTMSNMSIRRMPNLSLRRMPNFARLMRDANVQNLHEAPW